MNLLYAGSFDPITNGHLNIIQRASELCSKLFIYVANNSKKKHRYSLLTRIEMIKKSCYNFKNVYILGEKDIPTAIYAKKMDSKIIRGLRNCNDLDYEMTIYNINKDISNIDTIFLPCDNKFRHISSSMVKELIDLNLPVDKYVPKEILEIL